MLFSISNIVSNSGIAMISLVLLSTVVCPSTNWCWQLHALTVCKALFLSFVVNERRAVFPSIAMISAPVVSISDDIQDWKACSISSAFNRKITRAIVSFFGITALKVKYFLTYQVLSAQSLQCPPILMHQIIKR
jgi:hypothetical protein